MKKKIGVDLGDTLTEILKEVLTVDVINLKKRDFLEEKQDIFLTILDIDDLNIEKKIFFYFSHGVPILLVFSEKSVDKVGYYIFRKEIKDCIPKKNIYDIEERILIEMHLLYGKNFL